MEEGARERGGGERGRRRGGARHLRGRGRLGARVARRDGVVPQQP